MPRDFPKENPFRIDGARFSRWMLYLSLNQQHLSTDCSASQPMSNQGIMAHCSYTKYLLNNNYLSLIRLLAFKSIKKTTLIFLVKSS